MNRTFLYFALCVTIDSCTSLNSDITDESSSEYMTAAEAITICRTSPIQSLNASLFPLLPGQTSPLPEIDHWRYLPAGEISGLTLIQPNDNRRSGGTSTGNELNIELEVQWGDFRLETPDRPGLKLVAVGEKGKMPTIPAPLIRVTEGTRINAKVTNHLSDSTITVFGFQERPSTIVDSLHIMPGETGSVSFDAGESGTYLYWVQLGKGIKPTMFGELPDEDQLSGALIVDPLEGSPQDRVFVINTWGIITGLEEFPFFESLTINGKSWPHTELLQPRLGETVRWRVINASNRIHPMHLHGFYFNVLERGDMLTSKVHSEDEKETMVTDRMQGKRTILLEWEASRPGKWLFHCHLTFHVSSGIRLPGSEHFDPPGSHQHMSGLVLGIDIEEGETDLVSKGEARYLTLHANDKTYGKKRYASFDFENIEADSIFSPGPPLILKQYQPTYITVDNHMSVATSIHWHGLELDSWADGVPEWSSSSGKTSPIIEPGESFEYKLSLMRPGTFVYHSHLDDISQLSKGLYGAIIVIGQDQIYDPNTDHPYVIGWKRPVAHSDDDVDINGWQTPPVQQAKVGENHRIRLINIAPAGSIGVRMLHGETIVPLRFFAKDGATLRDSQQVLVDSTPRYDVGETADYIFTPAEAGEYTLDFGFIQQKWVVTE